MQKILIAALMALLPSLSLLPSLALAQQGGGEKLVVAKCSAGQGCRCALSDFDLETVSFLTGQDLPPEAVKGTYVMMDGAAHLSPLSPDEVHRQAGGTGRCEMALFDPVLPRDGLWQGTVRVQSMQGCHPMVAEMVPAIAAGMEMRQQIDWDGRFHPQKLAAGETGDVVDWREQGPGSFTGRLRVPQNDMLTITSGLTARLVTPDRATATLRLRLAAQGGNKAVMEAAGMADCRSFAVYDFRRIGD